MKLKKTEGLRITGRWRLTARHIRTGEMIIKEGKNLIVTTGKQLVGDMLIDRSGYDTGMTWQAIGTNAGAPAIGDTTLNKVHKVIDAANVVTSPDASDQATLNTLLNEIKADYNAHRVSTTYHDAADTANVVDAADASDLDTSKTLANQVKTKYNAHRSQAGVHPNSDVDYGVSSADASNLATCITLANEEKADYNNHLGMTREAARKAITSRTRSGNVITFSTFFTAGESTYNIKEAGVFGHSTASVTPDSGVLASHWLVTFDNSGGLYDLTFDLVWTVG